MTLFYTPVVSEEQPSEETNFGSNLLSVLWFKPSIGQWYMCTSLSPITWIPFSGFLIPDSPIDPTEENRGRMWFLKAESGSPDEVHIRMKNSSDEILDVMAINGDAAQPDPVPIPWPKPLPRPLPIDPIVVPGNQTPGITYGTSTNG